MKDSIFFDSCNPSCGNKQSKEFFLRNNDQIDKNSMAAVGHPRLIGQNKVHPLKSDKQFYVEVPQLRNREPALTPIEEVPSKDKLQVANNQFLTPVPTRILNESMTCTFNSSKMRMVWADDKGHNSRNHVVSKDFLPAEQTSFAKVCATGKARLLVQSKKGFRTIKHAQRHRHRQSQRSGNVLLRQAVEESINNGLLH